MDSPHTSRLEGETGRDPSSAPPAIPKPKITGKGVGLAALFWVLYAVLYGLLIARSEDLSFVWALSGQVISNSFLALYSVPVWWITVREMDRVHWGWIAGAHLVIAPLYAWMGLESYLIFYERGLGVPLRSILGERYGWAYFSNLTVYIIQFAGYHLVRNVQRLRLKEQQASELLARAREQELAALKAQINPHFLFNTLNSISATLKRDPEQAREMIAKLADMMRYALDSSDRSLVSLQEEIAFVRQYLALESHRFSDRLEAQIRIHTTNNDLDTPVPPMILQPLVENALQHGVGPSEEGGTVQLTVELEGDRLQVCVKDTGVGPTTRNPLSSDSEGVGLANTSARLKHMYGPSAALQIGSNRSTGFRVWFSLPRNGANPKTSRPSIE